MVLELMFDNPFFCESLDTYQYIIHIMMCMSVKLSKFISQLFSVVSDCNSWHLYDTHSASKETVPLPWLYQEHASNHPSQKRFSK